MAEGCWRYSRPVLTVTAHARLLTNGKVDHLDEPFACTDEPDIIHLPRVINAIPPAIASEAIRRRRFNGSFKNMIPSMVANTTLVSRNAETTAIAPKFIA